VRVGARLTAATSALLVLGLGTYAVLDLRAGSSERQRTLQREAKDQAASVRTGIDLIGVREVLADPDRFAARFNSVGSPWTVTIVPRQLLKGTPPPELWAQVQRMRTMLDLKQNEIVIESDDEYGLSRRLEVASLLSPEGFELAGTFEVVRSTEHLDDARSADLRRTLGVMAVIIALTLLAIVLLTRTVITRPIDKLVAGIDDVARGDLSHVLLSERDDEIGTLATRFTDMTTSLRESRAETERQNQARRQLEQHVAQTEKLASIGQIAAEIAHEVGTPLNVIAGRARSLGKKADNAEAVEKNAQIIAEQTARITRIIQRLLDFTRRTLGPSETTQVNLNEVCLSIMEFLENKFAGSHIKTTLARAEGLPRVKGEPDRLQQVLLNLVLNAIEAMPGGGSLLVETSVVHRRRPGLERAPEQRYVVVEVSDSGPGVPEEIRDKIFEPFYTSKQGEGGSGLGLAVCFGIIKEHDGWIELDDRDGGTGAVFRVFLPAEDAATARAL
jgi:signal transduction histidine kinase